MRNGEAIDLIEVKFDVSLFVNKRDNMPKKAAWSWVELCHMFQNPAIRAEKDGPLFSPATFNGTRANGNVDRLSLLIFDIDHKADLDTIKKQLSVLCCKYMVCSTHSHLRKTDSNPNSEPRFRVVIPLTEPIVVLQFPALWSFVKEKTGLAIDEAAKDTSRMYYKPAIAHSNAPFEFYEQTGDLLNWQYLQLPPQNSSSAGPNLGNIARKEIDEGCRNPELFRIAKRLYGEGLGLASVESALYDINSDRCEPPLDQREIKAIALNAQKYPLEPFKTVKAMSADNENPNSGQSEKVIQLIEAAGICFFNSADGETFATIPIGSHHENHYVNSQFFRNWISHRFWEAEGKVPKSQVLHDALNALNGRAKFDSPTCEVFVRLAEFKGRVYLDLANEMWQVVEISTLGWQIIEGLDSPVKFRRPKGLGSLPTPTIGGDPMEVNSYINVLPEHLPLVMIWLLACLRPDKPFPVLIVNGEQGSAKSTTSRVFRRLVDPNKAELRTPPGDTRDLMIAATNSWLLAFDNLAKIPDWLSDSLCCLSTGAGFSTRTLYENNEESLFCAKRPILLNGITELATRADLLDRSLLIACPNLSKADRRDEETIWREFERDHARILGAILTAFSSTLRRLPEVRLTELERMADFEKFGVAAEAALGFAPGTFQLAYATNRREASEVAIDSSSTASIVIAFVREHNNWTGSATQLLTELKHFAETYKTLGIRPDDLPKKANILSGELKRTAPNLRANGIEFRRKKSGGRTITLEKTVDSSTESPKSSDQRIDGGLTEVELGDSDSIDDDRADEPGYVEPCIQDNKAYHTNKLDDVDDVDDECGLVNKNKHEELRSIVDRLAFEGDQTQMFSTPGAILGTANGKPYVKCKCGKHAFLGQACPYCSRQIGFNKAA